MPEASRRGRFHRAPFATRRSRLVTLVVVLAAAGLAAGLVLTQTGGNGQAESTTTPSSVVLTAGGLASFAKAHGSPIYWIGPSLGADYEVTTSPDGRVFLRYVPAGAQPQAQAAYVSVGTYPFANAYAQTLRAGGRKGFARMRTGGGAVAIYAKARPTNIYLAFPGINYQVELFDPKPTEARRVVLAGGVVPVP